MAAISVRGLSRQFRRGPETVVALDDVSFDLEPGELTVAAGPSGSGKTTLLSILAGLERADSGEILTSAPLPDIPVARLTWRHLAFVPQSQALLEELSIRDNVELPARLDPGAPGRSAAPDRFAAPDEFTASGRSSASGQSAASGRSTDDVLNALEIAHLADRYPSHTSGGEQQRAAIARALRLAPYVLLGDEPTGHQDRRRVDLVLGILRLHAYAGNVVLISSHDEEVIGSADRVVTLADGRITGDVRSHAARR